MRRDASGTMTPRTRARVREGTTALGALMLLAAGPLPAAEPPRVIELTQVPCQFLESEGGKDRGYQSRSIKDCEAIKLVVR